MFLDGVGIGKKNPEINPFFCARMPALAALCGGDLPHTPWKNISTNLADTIAINATLGVPGLPQSGTGQTAIFTGVNGAKIFGRHFGPHPPSTLRQAIAEKNIFHQLKMMGKSVIFANAFPQRFFEYTALGTRRLTVTTLSCQLAGIPLLTAQDLQRDEGISADFIRTQWPSWDIQTLHPSLLKLQGGISPASWRTTILHCSRYWLTAHAGHSQNMAFAVEVLERFDEFLSGFLESFNPDTTVLIITSDHGNIEDLSTKSHTRNRVPGIFVGKRRGPLVHRIKNLTHITPAIISLF